MKRGRQWHTVARNPANEATREEFLQRASLLHLHLLISTCFLIFLLLFFSFAQQSSDPQITLIHHGSSYDPFYEDCTPGKIAAKGHACANNGRIKNFFIVFSERVARVNMRKLGAGLLNSLTDAASPGRVEKCTVVTTAQFSLSTRFFLVA